MDGHNLLLMEKPAKSLYPCKGCKEEDVKPCYKQENNAGDDSYHLHKECYDSSRETHSIVFNLIGSNSNCKYAFHKEDLDGKGVCEACGDAVKGWFFKCKLCKKKSHYLHPCCAKLPIKKHVESVEGKIVIDLQAKTTLPSECQICGSKETSDGSGGWNYNSRCREYCYHWSCMKHMDLEKWNKDDDQDRRRKRSRETSLTSSQALRRMNTETQTVATQLPENGKRKKQDNDAAGKGIAGLPALPTRAKKRPTKKAILGFTAEALVELLNILFAVLGLPPLPLGLLLKLFK